MSGLLPEVQIAHTRLMGERDEALRQALNLARVDLLDLRSKQDSANVSLRVTAMRRRRQT